MLKDDIRYEAYVNILREELVPAAGCTEPIAIAYAAARAKEILGVIPDKTLVRVSGNIVKNAKSVVVPNTNGLKGIKAATAAGLVAGKANKILEVIQEVSADERIKIKDYLELDNIDIELENDDNLFFIEVNVFSNGNKVMVRIIDYHTNVVLIKKNELVLYEAAVINLENGYLTDKELLKVADIIEFAESVDIEDIREVIERQIEYNTKIAEDGLNSNYGANIAKVLLSAYGDDIKIRAKAMAAAGSDARMNGSELPVIIVSGSGNQGMTASLPVIEYAKELGSSQKLLLRALVISNLITIHQKSGIGRLSAYCGAVSAGAGSGAGIAYLHGGGLREIAHTVVNALAIVSGIVCDGAKSSCAAKIASSVDAGILGYFMFKEGKEFRDGDGIVKKGVENTISNVCRLAKNGMRETDKEILRIMTE